MFDYFVQKGEKFEDWFNRVSPTIDGAYQEFHRYRELEKKFIRAGIITFVLELVLSLLPSKIPACLAFIATLACLFGWFWASMKAIYRVCKISYYRDLVATFA